EGRLARPGVTSGFALAALRGCRSLRCRRCRAPHVSGLESLRSPRDLEIDPFAFGQRLEAVRLDGREVNEHVLPAFLGYESKTLGVVEPLHCTSSHCRLLSSGDSRSPLRGSDDDRASSSTVGARDPRARKQPRTHLSTAALLSRSSAGAAPTMRSLTGHHPPEQENASSIDPIAIALLSP